MNRRGFFKLLAGAAAIAALPGLATTHRIVTDAWCPRDVAYVFDDMVVCHPSSVGRVPR